MRMPQSWRTSTISVALWLLSCSPGLLFGQGDSINPVTRPVVSAIAIFGNKTTKAEIILREMTIQVGDTISALDIDYCQARIYSLGLFNRVEIHYIPMDSAVLLVEVDERWYFYPVPMLGIVDRDWEKWYYGLGVTHQNFRGWNERIFAGFVLGYNPWVSLSYVNPWIFGRSQMFSESAFRYQQIVNKSRIAQGEWPNFTEEHYTFTQSVGKRYGIFLSTYASIGYSYLEVSDKRFGRTASPEGIDRFLSFGMGGRYDTRNLGEYPTQGTMVGAGITKKGIGFGDVDFVAYSVDLRTYQTVFRYPILALRTFSRWTSGPSIPNYEHNFFGFSERLRGHFAEEMEGENIAGASAEFRIPVIKSLYVTIPDAPIPEFATWKFALYAAAFFDTGTVWSESDRFDWKNLPYGYGIGLHLLLPYSYVVRAERAWNEHGRGEWILDVGVPF